MLGGAKKALPEVVDAELLEVVHKMRDSAGVEVHLQSITTQVRALLRKHKQEHILKESGGKYVFDKCWASRWLATKGYRLRAGTRSKTVHILTPAIHADMLFRASLQIKDFAIPKELVVNIDETGINLVPAGNKTFAKKGEIQVPIQGLGDKRQLTGIVPKVKLG